MPLPNAARAEAGRGAREWILALVVISLCSAWIVVVRVHTASEPLEVDLQTYALIAHEWLAGKSLYADLFDHKPPAIYWTFALGEALAGPGMRGVVAINLAATFTSLAAIGFAARRASGVAALAACAFWALVSGDRMLQANQPNTEAFINAASAIWLALLLGLRPDSLQPARLVGLAIAAAAALLYKPVMAPPLAMSAIAHVLLAHGSRETFRRSVLQVGLVAIGCAAILGAVIALFALTGRLPAMIDALYSYNVHYAGSTSLGNLVQGVVHIERLLPFVMACAVPLIGLTILGVTLGLRARERFYGILLFWLVGVVLAVAWPGKAYPHYYQLWLPGLSIGAGAGIERLRVLGSGRTPWLAPAAATIALLWVAAIEVPDLRLAPDEWASSKVYLAFDPESVYGAHHAVVRELGERIGAWLEDDEDLYAWGNEPGLYWWSGHGPITRALWVKHMTRGPLSEALTAEAVGRLRANPPALIVTNTRVSTPEGLAHPVLQLIAERYRPFAPQPRFERYRLWALEGSRLASLTDSSTPDEP